MLDPHGVVVEDLPEEVPYTCGVDPGGAEPGFDLAGRQVGWDDLAQFFGVDRVAGIVGGGAGTGRRPMFGAEDRGAGSRGGRERFRGPTSAPEFKVRRSLSRRLLSRGSSVGWSS